MFTLNQASDKLAITLSAVCAIHCLALPILATFLPSILTASFADESFHFWMVIFVIPVSIYALALGCKQHKRFHVLAMGVVGVGVLVMALILGEGYLNELQEKILTLLGSSAIAIGHYWNFRLCRHEGKCLCSN